MFYWANKISEVDYTVLVVLGLDLPPRLNLMLRDLQHHPDQVTIHVATVPFLEQFPDDHRPSHRSI